MQHKSIAFIGAGNMSRSIIAGMINSGYPASRIMAANPSRPKLDALESEFAVAITQDNQHAVDWADVIVLAVKPQILASVCQALAQQSNLQGKLFVSVAAGVTCERIQEMLGLSAPVVRTMPNTPSALGKGMTGLFASAQVSAEDKAFSQALMEQVGEILWVAQEEQLHHLTAAAGSSPAYFFLFLEAMEKKAQSLGFSAEDARQQVQQAMLGAAEMVCQHPDLSLETLRTQVTSKGGVTAKAIEHFENQGLANIVDGAMDAAVERSQQMSKEF